MSKSDNPSHKEKKDPSDMKKQSEDEGEEEAGPSSFDQFVAVFNKITFKGRAAPFTDVELRLLREKFEEFKHILTKMGNEEATKERQKVWQEIADYINDNSGSGVKRTREQVKRKHYDIAAKIKTEAAGTGGRPPPANQGRTATEAIEEETASESVLPNPPDVTTNPETDVKKNGSDGCGHPK